MEPTSDEAAAFWSKVSRSYDRVVDAQIGPATRGQIRDRLAKEAGLGTVVEFGCGTGYYTEVLAARAERVVATDVAPGMIAVARERVGARNMQFGVEDCQRTSLESRAFDTAFMGLLLHFTEPAETLREMCRVLKPGGTLIIANLAPLSLSGFDRIRCVARIVYQGLVGYRTKPPKASISDALGEAELCALLGASGFMVASAETFRDASRSSHIPVEYIRATTVRP